MSTTPAIALRRVALDAEHVVEVGVTPAERVPDAAGFAELRDSRSRGARTFQPAPARPVHAGAWLDTRPVTLARVGWPLV